MDGFVNKVKSAPAPPSRVVSLRSLDTIELARMRSSLRFLSRRRDELLRALGAAVEAAFTENPQAAVDAAMMAEHLKALNNLSLQVAATERQLQRAQLADRVAARGVTPFLTVCSCGAPLLPEDETCSACGRNVEGLIRLARESKAQVVSIPCTCGVPLVSGIRFCPDCGRSVVDLLQKAGLSSADVTRCAGCGEAASPGDRFCSSCGKAIG